LGDPHGKGAQWPYHIGTTATTLLILFPLCLLRDVSSLGVTSVVGIASSFGLIFVIIGKAFQRRSNDKVANIEFENADFFGSELGLQLGTLVLFYTNQDMVFAIFGSLKDKSLETWDRVATITYSTLFIAQTGAGLAVLLIVGIACIPESVCILACEKTASSPTVPSDGAHQAELFQKHDFSADTDLIMLFSRWALTIVLIFMFVLNHFAARDYLNSLLVSTQGWEKDNATRSHIMTFGILASALFFSIVLSDVSTICAFTGYLAGIPLGYIIPSVIGLAVMDTSSEPTKEDQVRKYKLWTVVVVFSLISIVGITCNIFGIGKAPHALA